MATVESNILRALTLRMAALVLNPVHLIAWANVEFPGKLANGQPRPMPDRYLRVTHFPNTTERLFIGSNDPHQYQGIFQVIVVDALKIGEVRARETAGIIANHFPVDARFTSEGVTVRITKRPNIASALITDTELQIPVSVFYECFA